MNPYDFINQQVAPPPPPKLTYEQKLIMVARKLAYIKSECHQAVHAMVLRDRLRDLIEVIEFLLLDNISNAQPNLVPGTPAGLLDDPTKTKVEFYGGPGLTPPSPGHIQGYAQLQQPQAPVTNGDVQFIQGPPAGQPGTVGGQTVEFFQTAENHAQRVEIIGGPNQSPTAPVTNQPAQIVGNRPTLTVEAGSHVPPPPGIFPGFPARTAPTNGA